MGFFDSVKNGAVKTKVQGEIVLIDRQIATQQSAFGVDFYDKVAAASTAFSVVSTAVADAMKIPFDECRRDVHVKCNERDAAVLEVERVGCSKERSAAKNLNAGVMTKAGNWMSDTGKEAQLKVRIKLLEREMYLRKQRFGVAAFESIMEAHQESSNSNNNSAANNMRTNATAATAAVGGMMQKITGGATGNAAADREKITNCLDTFARTINLLKAQKEAKQREIAAIEPGVFAG